MVPRNLAEDRRYITLHRFAHFLRLLLRLTGVIGSVAAVTIIDFRLLHVNSPTAAFSFLLLILGLATRVGMKESIVASLASMLAYKDRKSVV